MRHSWTGLLVEPNPDFLPMLVRKTRNSWILPNCLSPTRFPVVVDFDAMRDYGGIITKNLGKENKPGNIHWPEWEGPVWRRTLKVKLIHDILLFIFSHLS